MKWSKVCINTLLFDHCSREPGKGEMKCLAILRNAHLNCIFENAVQWVDAIRSHSKDDCLLMKLLQYGQT